MLAAAPSWASPVSAKPLATAEVRTALAKAYRQGPDAMVALCAELGRAGGVAAVEGLVELHDHRSGREYEKARIAALEALAQIGLRSERAHKRLAESLAGSTSERLAAITALGRLGDGRDMRTLLTFARDESREIKLAAFRSLKTLTGASVPFVYARWTHWWRTTKRSGMGPLYAALDALEEDPKDEEHWQKHVTTIAENGWIDLAEVEMAIEEWLAGSDALLQAAASHLAGKFRLLDYGPRIAKIRVHGFDPPRLEDEIRKALKDLGMTAALDARVAAEKLPK